MKDHKDDLTIDLIEGEPVKITHLQADRRKAMGYTDPKSRPACRNCKMVETVVHFENTCTQFSRHWCRIGGFRVMLGGCCKEHQPAPNRKGW